MNEIDINSIVKIEQMPKVFSQLEKIGELITKTTKDLDKLKCTDENKQEVKNRRTEINKTLEALEERRKEIKNKLLEPYDIFEEKYNKECKEKLQNASNLLKEKIDTIEETQKQEKMEELELFAKEHIKFNNLEDIISFEDIGLNVTLSASMKSLQVQILKFISKVVNDIKLIELEEYKDEILIEYKKNKDFTQSKLDVCLRHKQLDELKEKQKEIQLQIDEEAKVVEKVEEITTPKEIIEDEDKITVTFTITDTKENIIKVREFMKKEGIKYE